MHDSFKVYYIAMCCHAYLMNLNAVALKFLSNSTYFTIIKCSTFKDL